MGVFFSKSIHLDSFPNLKPVLCQPPESLSDVLPEAQTGRRFLQLGKQPPLGCEPQTYSGSMGLWLGAEKDGGHPGTYR